MTKASLLLAAAVASAIAIAAPAQAVVLTPIAGFSQADTMAAPPADSHRVFVVEQGGKIWDIRDGVKLADPFLDVSGVITTDESSSGLLGLAFAPDYATSGLFYVYYTASDSAFTSGHDIVVDELQRSAADPDRA